MLGKLTQETLAMVGRLGQLTQDTIDRFKRMTQSSEREVGYRGYGIRATPKPLRDTGEWTLDSFLPPMCGMPAPTDARRGGSARCSVRTRYHRREGAGLLGRRALGSRSRGIAPEAELPRRYLGISGARSRSTGPQSSVGRVFF